MLYEINEMLLTKFNNVKFRHTIIFPQDIINEEDQRIIVNETHCRAHRSYNENFKQINQMYYWPNMIKQIKEKVRHCEICNKNKYQRHPKVVPIGEAPIPNSEGAQVHLDIFYAQKLQFLTCIDIL